MLPSNYNPINKTLKRINAMVGRSFVPKGITVFLKNPSDSKTAPGKRIGQDFTLSTVLFKHPELSEARIVEFDDFYGETIIRVTIPRSYY